MKLQFTFALVLSSIFALFAQQGAINTPTTAKSTNMPFGSNTKYAFGMMPNNLPQGGAFGQSSDAAQQYNNFVREFIEYCGPNQARVKFDNPSQTVSEGIAYTMLLAAYAGDQNIFDRLWAYYKQHRNQNGVMHWRIDGCNNVSGQNGATDAEVDAAMALIVADCQWGSTGHAHPYKADANALLNALRLHELSTDRSEYTFYNGDAWKPNCRNPSYQAPAYARYWATWVDANGNIWDKTAKDTEILHSANSKSTRSGLSSNWSTPTGPASSACSGSGTSWNGFGYDACRAPWRQGVDYLWWGDQANGMQSIIDTQVDFWINKGGASTVQGGNNFNQDGNGNGDHNNAFVSMIGAQSLAASNTPAHQNFVNALYTENNKELSANYFSQVLQVIGLFVQTGNFWKPCALAASDGSISMTLTSPVHNAQYFSNQNITFSVSNESENNNIKEIEYFVNGNTVGKVSDQPYNLIINPLAIGTHSMYAKIVNEDGVVNQTATNQITVMESSSRVNISLTSPKMNESLSLGNDLILTADALTSNGSIRSVAFFIDGHSVGIDNDAPYGVTVSSPSAGNHIITAIATNTSGESASSASHPITVPLPFYKTNLGMLGIAIAGLLVLLLFLVMKFKKRK